MNQILYTIEGEAERRRTKKIIFFFAIAIIVFGAVMMGMGGYKVVVAKIERAEAIEAAKVPNLELEAEKDTNNAIIRVNHIRDINSIIYSWNDEEEIKLEENMTKKMEKYIEIPSGISTLKVTVTDVLGNSTTKIKEYSFKGTYMEVSIIDNKSIKITATDVTGFQSIRYKWNDDEEITKYPEDTTSTVMEIASDIPIGTNTLRIKAVNNENKIEEKEVTVLGISKPTMQINYDPERTVIIMKLNDDQGIQSYSYTLSSAPIEDIAKEGKIIPGFKEKLKVVTSQTKDGQSQTSVTEQLKFQEGFNYLEVTITNIEGVEEKFSGWCAK